MPTKRKNENIKPEDVTVTYTFKEVIDQINNKFDKIDAKFDKIEAKIWAIIIFTLTTLITVIINKFI